MELGLARNEVKLVPYTENWRHSFEQEKEAIRKHTGLPASRIAHIGSTAIKGMQAKPIIDIMAGMETLDPLKDSFVAGLKEAGFLRLKVERPNAIVCAKFTDETYMVKTHYLHLVELDGEMWHDLLFFRDYLNNHETERKEYEAIKLDFLRSGAEGIDAYTESKKDFVKRIHAIRHMPDSTCTDDIGGEHNGDNR